MTLFYILSNSSTIHFRKGKSVSSYRFLTSALEEIETGSNVNCDVIVLPPTSHNQDASDEEDDDDVLDQEWQPTEVAGEIEVHNHDNSFDDEDCIAADSAHRWRKNERLSLDTHIVPSPSDVCKQHEGKDAFEIFELFLTRDIIEFICEQTNLYANRDRNEPNFNVDIGEMSRFIGLLLISGYHSLPKENDYWSTSLSREAPIFAKTMSRERFKKIKKFLHVAYNQKLTSSKVSKVEPLFNKLKNQCQQFGVFDEFISVDESMVPYKGLHSARQFIKNKPIRFGYKVWMLCGSTGFPYNFEIYCGKQNDRKSSLGQYVVNKMLSPVTNRNSHVVFFDSFFTSYQLLSDLAEKGIRACGTIRENRTGHCPLKPNKEIQKQPRGTYEYLSDGTVLCVKWNDNCAVTVASNYYGVTPLHKAERRVKNETKKIVDQPRSICMYNQGMGGVDLCDRQLASYRPRLRSRKWWWNLFSHALNLSVVAAHEFYNHIHPSNKMDHHDFRITVAETLVKRQVPRVRLGGPSAPTPSSVRYDGINHYLVPCKQGRCVICSKNTRIMCIRCEKKLHKAICSEEFHTK